MNATALCTLALAAAASLFAGTAEARPVLPRHAVVIQLPRGAVAVSPRVVREYEARQARQMDRIVMGTRSGVLSRAESERLMRQQTKLERKVARALADRVLTRGEMRNLDSAFLKAGGEIARLERNGRVAPRMLLRPAPRVVVRKPLPRHIGNPRAGHHMGVRVGAL